MLGLAATALVVFAQDARAKNGPPKSEQISSVAQYRESIPASEGPTLPGATPSTTAPLPAPVTREIEEQGGTDAPTLVRIATRSELGAPNRPLPKLPQVGLDKRTPGAQSGVTQQRPERKHAVPRALAASTGSFVSGSGGGHLLGLVVVLALIALAGLAASRRRAPLR